MIDAHTFAIWHYLITVKPCLTISFCKNLCVIGKNVIEWGQKNNKMIKIVEMTKMPTVNPLFSTNHSIETVNIW